MALILIISLALNMIQLNKDALRCKKSNNQDKGCSIFVSKEKK